MQLQSVDYSRKWYVMAAVAMGVFLSTIDSSIVNVALPTLVRAFDTEFPMVQWVVLAYLLARAADTIADTRIVSPEKRLHHLLSFRQQVVGPVSPEGR